MLTSGVLINLLDCCYLPEMVRNIISFYILLFKDDLCFAFDNYNGRILVYKHGCFYFKASPYNEIYENVVCVSKNDNIIFSVSIHPNVYWINRVCVIVVLTIETRNTRPTSNRMGSTVNQVS